jgi:hypothetical protein
LFKNVFQGQASSCHSHASSRQLFSTSALASWQELPGSVPSPWQPNLGYRGSGPHFSSAGLQNINENA